MVSCQIAWYPTRSLLKRKDVRNISCHIKLKDFAIQKALGWSLGTDIKVMIKVFTINSLSNIYAFEIMLYYHICENEILEDVVTRDLYGVDVFYKYYSTIHSSTSSNLGLSIIIRPILSPTIIR